MRRICVVGLGYIGLPTSAMFATHGCEVVGVDINKKVVEALNRGEVIIEEPYLDILVQAAVRSGNLTASETPKEADVFIITVPTPINEDKSPNLTHVIEATKAISPYLRKGNIVVLESTSPVGTVDELMCPILEDTGLKLGDDLFLGYSPERVLPGKILWELVNNNRVVGGINEISSQKIKEIYALFVNGEILITNSRTAEMCKMMENTYRDVNIALANELSKISESLGINAWEVIDLCNHHPRVNLHMPGPGVGGHCLAVDPWFIVSKSPDLANIIKLSRETNDSMPSFVVNGIKNILSDISGQKRVTVLGLTYKPNVDDLRESPVLKIIELLKETGEYEISLHDPYVSRDGLEMDNPISACRGSDLIVLGVHHDTFRNLPLADMARVMRTKRLFDTRDFFKRDKVVACGLDFYLLGFNSQHINNDPALFQVAATKAVD